MEVNNVSRDPMLNHFWKLVKKRDISNEAVVTFHTPIRCESFAFDSTQIPTMALPPEQINIKRRREEEPVDTLCKSLPFLRWRQ